MDHDEIGTLIPSEGPKPSERKVLLDKKLALARSPFWDCSEISILNLEFWLRKSSISSLIL